MGHITANARALIGYRDTEQYIPNSYKLVGGSPAALEAMITAFDEARVSIGVQFFSFEADEVGLRVAAALMRAAKRNVRVRVIIDSNLRINQADAYVYSLRLNKQERRKQRQRVRNNLAMVAGMRAAGVEVQFCSPLWIHWYTRDHRKLVIVDERHAWLGGFNPTAQNFAWHDFIVKIAGGAARPLAFVFDATWNGKMSGGTLRHNDGVVMVDMPMFPSTIWRATLRLIDHAEERIVIESPYLQGGALWRTLFAAARRDVPVDVIVPFKNHKRLWVPTERQLKRAVSKGLTVHRFEGTGGMAHTRALLADDWAIFGSHAFNAMSSGKLAELSMATRNRSLVHQLERFLQNDMANSQLQGAK